MKQEIKFCSTSEGVNIAYSAVGKGPSIVKAANWLNHLELDWSSPVWSHWLSEFTRGLQLVRYDQRGTGLSDRKVTDLSLDAFVDDLHTVVEALKLDRFPVLAISQGGPVAIAYAIKYPEKVSHLVIYGSFATGWKKSNLSGREVEKREAQLALIKQGWDSKNPAIRQLFTTTCLPNGTAEEHNSFNELQLQSVSGKNAAAIFEALGEIDVFDRLPEVSMPTLVLHSKDDALVPFEEGRRMASHIPNARFVPLESPNHLLLQHEPAWTEFVSEVNNFLDRPNYESQRPGYLMVCPKCDRTFTADLLFCLDDGERLANIGDVDPATLIR